MKTFFLVTLLTMTSFLGMGQSQEASLAIKVFNEDTGLPLENVNVFIEPCSCGGTTDDDGDFFKTLKKDAYKLYISYVGFKSDYRSIVLDDALVLKIGLFPEEEVLSEVVVRAKRVNDNLESAQMGVVQLKSQELKKIPSALGEFDVLRGVTLLAGVSNAGEISNGISVRGGSLDQNLLLYDYAPIFNPTHLFGLFSVFTPDVISSVNLYRANIPSRFGGRTTSVLDVKVRNPYVEKFKLSGGIGLVSSRLNVELPLIKDKLMLVAGGRAGFTGFLLPLFSERLENTKANFYDSTFKLLYLPTENDQITYTGFLSKDFYQIDLVTQINNINAENNQYDFRTFNNTLNWVHTFNNDANLRTILVNGDYNPKTIFPEVQSDNEIEFNSNINYLSFISEYSKKVNSNFDYYGGVQANRYRINPGELDPGIGNTVSPVSLLKETGYELSAFANLNWKPIEHLSISGGLRYNHFLFQGPFNSVVLDDATGRVTGVKVFEKGEKVESYNNLEPRLGVNVRLGETTSLKASYARINQYLQNVYNSTTPLPTSRWKLSDINIKPQISNTLGFGVYKKINNGVLEVDLEGYYRISENNLAYKPGADFFLEEFLEQSVVQGEGRAYGAELSVRKPKGPINGWINYTWSRSLLRTENENLADRINNNQWYPSDFDRPHSLNATVNFEGNKWNTLSLNFTGQTGRPYSVSNGIFPLDALRVPIFLERNNARLPVYHRLDLSWNVHFSGSKESKRWLNDWTFTIYNLYGRKNPFNIYYTQRNGSENSQIFGSSPLGAFQLSALNSPLLSLTYNFTFQ